MFPIAGCRQPAIRSGATRPCGCSLHVQPASGHHDAAHMRQSQPRPCIGARTRATRMPQGGKELPWWKETNLDACASSANAENKTPPGMATRGRSRFLGRSGWPISQGVSRMSEVQVPCAFGTAQVAAVRTQRQAAARGLQGGLAVEGIGGLHGKNSVAEKTATWPTGAHDTPLVCDAQHFFHFIFEGRPTVVESVASGCR